MRQDRGASSGVSKSLRYAWTIVNDKEHISFTYSVRRTCEL